MRSRFVIALSVLIAVAAAGQTTSTPTATTTGSFKLTDTDNIFAQGTSISLTNTNATFAATATFDTQTPTQVDGFHFAASPTGAGAVWTLDFQNGTSAVQPGTFSIDGSTVTAAVTFISGTNSSTCQAGAGTVAISAITTNAHATTTSAFTNLQGTFTNLQCTNVPSVISGAFGFTSTTPTPTPTPQPQPPSGGGTIPGLVPSGPGFRPPAPAPTPAPPQPTLTVSGPVLTLLSPVSVMSGQPTTLQFTTVTNSTFNAPVTLSATSDQPGPTFSFSPATIAAPGNGTSNLTIDPTGLPQMNLEVTVTATGGGLTASTSFLLDVFCDPPIILGINQPASAVVGSGGTAQLTVTPNGSGPFTYQWYQGYQGLTSSPIAGASSAAFTAPALTSTTQYWVRVTNACGTADSATATLTVPGH